MIFYKVTSTKPVIKIVTRKLIEHLQAGEKVFWLVTGGTAISVEVAIAQQLKGRDVSKLTVALMDERYGPIGHPDSNWQQLLEAGFAIPGATMVPILRGKDRATSTSEFAAILEKKFAAADYSLGQFGIGPDGHTAGILPASPQIDTSEFAVSYSDHEATQDFTEGVYRDKDRITITASAVARLDEVVVCALGEKKHFVLDKLEQDIPITLMPSQALKRAAVVSIYNDYKGDEL